VVSHIIRIFGYNQNLRVMKSFKVRDGKMLVDGVYYSDKPSENVIKGKMGRISHISIEGRQFFPYGGQFDDGTIKTVDSTTEVLEPTDSEVKVEKKKRAKKGSK
jgi:hypothetical protein